MAVVLMTIAPSREAYEQVLAEIGNDPQPGCIVHTATEVDGGVRIVDVWESQQAIQEFFDAKLGPAFAKLGLDAVQPELTEPFNVQRH